MQISNQNDIFAKNLISLFMEKKKGTEIASLGEFGLIDRLTSRLKRRNPSTLLSAGDDAAVIDLGEEVMLLTTDMMTEGIDFDLSYFPLKHLGYKAIVRGVNDILAMNAKPQQVVVALGVSAKISVEALDELYEGMEHAAKELGVDIVGGDTTASRDKIAINVVAIGRAPKQNIKRRSAAKVGDVVCVTGKLGTSSKGLVDIMFGDLNTAAAKAHRRGQARTAEGVWLGTRPEVHAMMDISDGIASDIKHIMELSGVGARIEMELIPTDYDIRYATTGGEDYELLLTVDSNKYNEVAEALHKATGTTLTKIGEITAGSDVEWLDCGKPTDIEMQGFTHF